MIVAIALVRMLATVAAQDSDEPSATCENCAPNLLNSQKFHEKKLENEKLKILGKLGIEARPEVSFEQNQVPSVLQSRFSQNDQGEEVRTTSLVSNETPDPKEFYIIGEKHTEQCEIEGSMPGACFSFHLTPKVLLRRITEAVLYLFFSPARRPNAGNATLFLTETSRTDATSEEQQITAVQVPFAAHWLQLNITTWLNQWRQGRENQSNQTKILQSCRFPVSLTRRPNASNATLLLTETSRTDATSEEQQITAVQVPFAAHWLQLNITTWLNQWRQGRENQSNQTKILQIRCPSCSAGASLFGSEGQQKPTLLIEAEPPKLPVRSRRSDFCSPNLYSFCCRRSFYVNFTEIRWNDWIMQPPGYHANYCTGNCRLTSTGVYGSVTRNVVNTREANGQTYDQQLIPCCAPTKMRSLTLLYALSPGEIRKKTLENMVVESCGC